MHDKFNTNSLFEQFPWYMMEEEHAIQTDFFRLDSTQELYIRSDSQETSLQTHTHIFSLEIKVEILTDLN